MTKNHKFLSVTGGDKVYNKIIGPMLKQRYIFRMNTKSFTVQKYQELISVAMSFCKVFYRLPFLYSSRQALQVHLLQNVVLYIVNLVKNADDQDKT